jgi:DeoR family transcriptional regulator, suf operon transcriptional repressor
MGSRSLGTGSMAGTRGRIIDLIRRSPTTVTEIAAQLELTYNAVRGHLTALERDGLVRSGGVRKGETRPSAVYELAPGVDDALSRAYMPFASHLVRSLSERLPERDLDEIMRDVGRRLATEWPRAQGTVAERIENASALLQELGAPNEIDQVEGTVRIRAFGCLLAAAVQGRPQACRAMEALLTEFIETPVRECCERGDRPRCCFEIVSPTTDIPS